MEKYETIYGIYNHDAEDPNRPLALIGMHWGENSAEGSTLYERVEQFAELKIHKFFGISFKEFMELPTDVCTKILEVANKHLKLETTVADGIAAQLGKTGNQ